MNLENGEFGSLTHYDYGFRIYNPAIGKFLSVDPLTKSYPMLTPYQFASNTPVWAIDLDGLEALTNQELLRMLRDKKPETGNEYTVSIPVHIKAPNSVERPPMEIYPGKRVNEKRPYSVREIDIDGANIIVYDQFSSNAALLFREKLDRKRRSQDLNAIGFATPGGFSKFFAKLFRYGDDVAKGAPKVKKVLKEYSEQGGEFVDDFARMSDEAAKGVGATLRGVNDVITNPSLLQGKTLSEVQSILKNTSGWKEGAMNQGRSAGKGWTMRQLNSSGKDVTDLYIQYHPGTHRHFNGNPYWKVSSGKGGVQWFEAGK